MTSLQRAPRQRPAGRSERIGVAVRDAVIELVSEGDTADLTFEHIASRAGVSRGTLYRRWENRSRLLTWVLLGVMAEMAPPPDTGSLRGDVLETVRNLNAVLASPMGTGFFRVALVDAPEDTAVAEAIRSFWAERLSLAEPIYQRATKRGELDESLDYELVTDLVYGPFFYRFLRGDPMDEAYAQKVIDTSLRTLTPR